MGLASFEIAELYPLPAERVWAAALSHEILKATMSPLFTYDGLPEGDAEEGQEIRLVVRLGPLALARWRILFTRRDDEAFLLESEESGTLVKSWRHETRVEAQGPEAALYCDRLAIDAGLLTGFVGPWAVAMYTERHTARRAALGLSPGEAA